MSLRGHICGVLIVIVGLSLFSGVAVAGSLVELDADTDLDGDGTDEDPYQIENSSQLQAMAGNLSANYTLVAAIDASNTSAWNGGAGFTPIGNATEPFTGSFNGSDRTISELYINRSTDDDIGLFGSTDGALIERVGLDSVSITGNVSVEGEIFVGGLVGNMSGSITNSSVTGTVDGPNSTGGLVGNLNGSVTNSYANSSVDGGSQVGGLVGINANDGEIITSYAVGAVNESGSATAAGGLVGNNTGTVENSYWDTESTGQTTSEAGTGLTTERMTGNNASADGNMDGFAFYDHWIPTESYPVLTWQFFAESTGDGDGSESNPFVVSDEYGLQAIHANLTASYELDGDIDASGTDQWNDGAGFEPIANGSSFSGSIDGGGHTISDLTINRSSASSVGLISEMASGSTVSDLSIVDATVSGSSTTGTLVGRNFGNISGVQITTDVQAGSTSGGEQSGLESVGGVVGYLGSDGRISDLAATGNVSAPDGTDIGGLVGSSSGSSDFDAISNATADVTVSSPRGQRVGGLLGDGGNYVEVIESSATGSVSGETNVGGLVGATESDIFRSFATGNVEGNTTSGENVGGLVGNSNGPIGNSSAFGNVTGNNSVGGFAGIVRDTFPESEISGSYSVGAVTGTSTVGGFAGEVSTISVVDSYWDTEASGTATATGTGPTTNITGLTTGELQGSAATENTNLSFNPVWIATDDYPIHVWRVDDYTLSLSETDIETDDTATSTVTLSLSDDSTQTATEPAAYLSSDSSVASVDGSGKITAADSGSTVISAEASGFDASVSLSVSSPSTTGSSSGSSSADDEEDDEPEPDPEPEPEDELTDSSLPSTGTNDSSEPPTEEEPEVMQSMPIITPMRVLGGGAAAVGSYLAVVLLSRTELFATVGPAAVTKAVASVPGAAGMLLAEPEQAAFVVSSVTLAVDEDHEDNETDDGSDVDVAPGELLAIEVTIENKGDVPGARVVSLSLDDREDDTPLDLDAHTTASVILEYQTTPADAGKTLGFTISCETDSADIDITVGDQPNEDDSMSDTTSTADDDRTADDQTAETTAGATDDVGSHAGETTDPDDTADPDEIDAEVDEEELDAGTRTSVTDRLWMQKGKILSYTAGVLIIYIGLTNFANNRLAGGLGIFLGVMALPIVRAQLPTATRVWISRYGKVLVVIIAALFSGVLFEPAVVFETIEGLFGL